MSKKRALLRIVWMDAFGDHQGWVKEADLESGGGIEVVSVGFKVKGPKGYVTLAASIASGDQLGGVISIPKGMVQSITPLRMPT